MDKNSDILKRIDRKSGMTVPEGYFAEFAARMTASLPKQEASDSTPQQQAPRLSTWRRLRPYIYMAAMFAGIWCMMKMFSMIGNSDKADLSIDNYPGLVTALNNDNFVDDYVYPNISESDVMDHILNSDLSVEELDELLNAPEDELNDDVSMAEDNLQPIEEVVDQP